MAATELLHLICFCTCWSQHASTNREQPLLMGRCWQVACLADNAAHLALEKDDPYVVQRKPHGHGDVHALLHSTGLVKRWQKDGVQWVCFFQDTNGLVFRALPAALGKGRLYVSHTQHCNIYCSCMYCHEVLRSIILPCSLSPYNNIAAW